MRNQYIKKNFAEKDYDKVRNLRNKARRDPDLHGDAFERAKIVLHLKKSK